MSGPYILAGVAAAVMLINLPFGYWRAGVPRFGWKWFVAVHAAVPLVVALRFLMGISLSLTTFPILVAAYFGGQTLGARYRVRRERGTG